MLAAAGLSQRLARGDGAAAGVRPDERRVAGRPPSEWLAAPEENQGAIMTSLLVDGRPIHGDPGLPAVDAGVRASCARTRAPCGCCCRSRCPTAPSCRSMRDVFADGADTFDIKALRAAADRQHRPLGGAERRLGGAVHHRAAAGRGRVGDAARRPGAEPGRGRSTSCSGCGCATSSCSTSAASAPSDVVTLRADVADRPQRARPGRPRDRGGAAADGQRAAYLPVKEWVSPAPPSGRARPAPAPPLETAPASAVPRRRRRFGLRR